MQTAKALVLLLMIAASAACGGSRAQLIEDAPTLAVPPVPPRTIDPAPPVEAPVIEPVPDLAPLPVTPSKPKPAPKNETKPEVKPETPPETNAAGGAAPTAPVEPLRSPNTPSGPEALRQIRESLSRTSAVLNGVDYQKLTPDGRLTYDSAKRFTQQAEEALEKGDLTQARGFALRAEDIAKRLQAR